MQVFKNSDLKITTEHVPVVLVSFNLWGSAKMGFLFDAWRCTVLSFGKVTLFRDSRGRDRMVVRYITTYAISAYHH